MGSMELSGGMHNGLVVALILFSAANGCFPSLHEGLETHGKFQTRRGSCELHR